MAKKINLLPTDLVVGKGTNKITKILVGTAMSAFSFVIVLATIGAGGVYFFTTRLSDLNLERDKLRAQVNSLEKTESGLVLTRDRLEKIEGLLSDRKVEERFKKQRIIIESNRTGIEFKESDIGSSGSNLILVSRESVNMNNLFDGFFGSQEFSKLTLLSMRYSKSVGYRIELEVF